MNMIVIMHTKPDLQFHNLVCIIIYKILNRV